jgi:hypothetical protein
MTDHLPMAEHLFISSSYVFQVIYNVIEVLPQALEIIFEVQRKRNNEKITRNKKSLLTYRTLFFFLSLDLSCFQTS